jgi:hypothetical protein
MINRRAFIAASVWAALTGSPVSRAANAHTGKFRCALSVSPFTELVLKEGITYTDGNLTASSTEELQRLFVAHGATELYARFGTQRKFTYGNHDHSVERGLERARLAAKLNLPFNPELGLFAQYGDITHQPEPDFTDYPSLKVPGPWHTLTLAQMLPILRGYGALIADEILATGAKVNVWDLGNEVERGVGGIAVPPIAQPPGWTYKAPDAVDPEIGKLDLVRYVRMSEADRVAWLSRHLWPYIGQAFAAVAEGIRSVDKQARFSTHTSGMVAYSPSVFAGFFRSLDAAGFKAEEAGLSYYPSADGKPANRFTAFKDMVAAATARLNRPVFIAEYGYPVGPFKFGKDNWANEVPNFPVSVQGQAKYLREVVAWGARTGHLSGIRPWAPDLPVPGWGEMSLFALEGRKATARPSIDSIREGLAAAGKP